MAVLEMTEEMKKAFDEIRQRVESNGDIILMSMEELRNAIGARKLGIWILKDIDKQLRARGLLYLPDTLPNYQHEFVMLYRQGSRVETIIRAVHSVSQESVDTLRDAAESESSQVLEQIRRLLCS